MECAICYEKFFTPKTKDDFDEMHFQTLFPELIDK